MLSNLIKFTVQLYWLVEAAPGTRSQECHTRPLLSGPVSRTYISRIKASYIYGVKKCLIHVKGEILSYNLLHSLNMFFPFLYMIMPP